MPKFGIIKMGTAKTHPPVKLIVGLISNDLGLFSKTCLILEKKFGKIDFKSRIFEFFHTDYYQGEMGAGLKRQFVSFKKLIDAKRLADIKIHTNRIEKNLSVFIDKKPQRRINIDPGYLESSKLILATTKDYSHRVYLRGGIYAEVTLSFYDRAFHPWQWTYPDYRTQQYLDVFTEIRKIYMKQIKTDRGK